MIEALDQDHDDVFSFALVDGLGAWDNDRFSIDDNKLIINGRRRFRDAGLLSFGCKL